MTLPSYVIQKVAKTIPYKLSTSTRVALATPRAESLNRNANAILTRFAPRIPRKDMPWYIPTYTYDKTCQVNEAERTIQLHRGFPHKDMGRTYSTQGKIFNPDQIIKTAESDDVYFSNEDNRPKCVFDKDMTLKKMEKQQELDPLMKRAASTCIFRRSVLELPHLKFSTPDRLYTLRAS